MYSSWAEKEICYFQDPAIQKRANKVITHRGLILSKGKSWNHEKFMWGGGKVQTASTYELDPIPTKIIYYRDVIILTRGISIWSTRYKNSEIPLTLIWLLWFDIGGEVRRFSDITIKNFNKINLLCCTCPIGAWVFRALLGLKNNFFSLSLTAVDLFVDQTWSDSTFGVKVGGEGGFNFSNPNNFGKFWSKPN